MNLDKLTAEIASLDEPESADLLQRLSFAECHFWRVLYRSFLVMKEIDKDESKADRVICPACGQSKHTFDCPNRPRNGFNCS